MSRLMLGYIAPLSPRHFHLAMPTSYGQRLPGALLSVTSAAAHEVCLVTAFEEPKLLS